MNAFFLISKIALVVFFLVMFLRRSKVIWGIGLLSVTSAILLDTFLGTFGREEMQEQFGFFFYFLAGALFAGGTFWLWGVLRPLIQSETSQVGSSEKASSEPVSQAPIREQEDAAEHFQSDLSPKIEQEDNSGFTMEQVADLAYDLGYYREYGALSVEGAGSQLEAITQYAERDGREDELELAIQRVLTPLTPDHLPRIEKIQADSPPTILRQYIAAHLSRKDLERVAAELELEWGILPDESFSSQVRGLLVQLDEAKQKDELLVLLRQIDLDTR